MYLTYNGMDIAILKNYTSKNGIDISTLWFTKEFPLEFVRGDSIYVDHNKHQKYIIKSVRKESHLINDFIRFHLVIDFPEYRSRFISSNAITSLSYSMTSSFVRSVAT